MAAQRDSQNLQSGTLNVLLHGAFTFVHDKINHCLVAAIPKLDQHAYRAGNWLAETELRGDTTYHLVGVKKADTLKFNRRRNVLVRFGAEQLSTNPVPYAILNFPYPKTIKSLRTANVARNLFTHAEDLIGPKRSKNVQQMATLQIFTYDILNENKLKLKADDGDGHYWEPAFTRRFNHARSQLGTQDFTNLHIFSSEEYYYRPSNTREDFNECVALLGAKLRLKTRFLPAGEIPNEGELPDGVAPQETEDLAPRTLRMARLGRLIVENGDANLAWRGNDALDGDPAGCGGLGGCLFYR